MQLVRGSYNNGHLEVVVTDDAPELDNFVHNSNGAKIPYKAIVQACKGEHYPMNLTANEGKFVADAVNIGIDACLEACNVPSRGDYYNWMTRTHGCYTLGRFLDCRISPTSLPTLLRRLNEMDYSEEEGESGENPGGLADSILLTLGFDEYGVFVGRDE